MTILILAAIGVLLNILGRCLILREDKALSDSSRPWVAFCPGAELVFLTVRWEHARVGAGMCALSMALAMPLIGQLSVLSKRPIAGGSQPIGVRAAFESLFKKQEVHARPDQQGTTKIAAEKTKGEKVEKLRHYLAEWYAMLAAKEPYLCTDLPDEMVDYNRSAAAYRDLLAVSKMEAAELDRMSPKLPLGKGVIALK